MSNINHVTLLGKITGKIDYSCNNPPDAEVSFSLSSDQFNGSVRCVCKGQWIDKLLHRYNPGSFIRIDGYLVHDKRTAILQRAKHPVCVMVEGFDHRGQLIMSGHFKTGVVKHPPYMGKEFWTWDFVSNVARNKEGVQEGFSPLVVECQTKNPVLGEAIARTFRKGDYAVIQGRFSHKDYNAKLHVNYVDAHHATRRLEREQVEANEAVSLF